jgi:alpha-methylacyl-CoA racemase
VLEKLLAQVDVLIDPFRPGVLESLDLDPRRLIKVNQKLVVARLTGFRRDGMVHHMPS